MAGPAAGDGVAAMPGPSSGPRPASAGAMFIVFTRLALQGFGGVLPVAQRVLVEQQRWLSREEFLEMLSIAQVLPGPNIVNLALMLGDRFFGGRGAAAAIAGILAAPLACVLALSVLATQWQGDPVVAAALRGMGVVAAGLVLATALKLLTGLRRSPLGPLAGGTFVALTAAAVGALRWPLGWVVLGAGLPGIVLGWWRLRR